MAATPVRTPPSLGAVFGGETGAFGGVAVAPDGSNINPVARFRHDWRPPKCPVAGAVW
jgi:hypothetical protein